MRNLQEQYKYETEVRGLSHRDALDQMKWMFKDQCKVDLDPYGTHTLCGEPATCDDPNFTYPLCIAHADQAWACIEADERMLANAY